jgi:selenocysteine-specific elongation factor
VRPLVLGTAGHIDHGKTALVRALTGVDTDRLPQERERGISIELGYAPLDLPSGRRVSVVDVPGHERFVRTMVAGATGIDLFLMVVAADDGVMPQTREHAAVLAGLGVGRGVVAVTKADLGDPELAALEASELLPDAEVVACSARTGEGIGAVAEALDRAAATLPGRADDGGAPVLHVDRVFSIRGAGTVVTGTLWSGAIGRGDEVTLQPAGRTARVRGVQVHDAAVDRARRRPARRGQPRRRRGARRRARRRASAAPRRSPAYVLDCALDLRDAEHGRASTSTTARARRPAGSPSSAGASGSCASSSRCSPAPATTSSCARSRRPDTLGGGVVLDPAARKHGPVARRPRPAGAPRARRARRLRVVDPTHRASSFGDPDALDSRLAGGAGAGGAPARGRPRAAERGRSRRRRPHLEALRDAGRAVRIGRSMWAHPARSTRSATASSTSSRTRARSPSPACATSCRRRASSPRRCSSTSTPRGSPCAGPTTRGSCAGGRRYLPAAPL